MDTPTMQEFIAHNIRLDDGRLTMPDLGWTLDQSTVVHATNRLLKLAFPGGLTGRSIVDLGCLEGGHAVEFARAGMASTGIEIRDSNFANCQFVKQNLSLPNLDFVQDDANRIGNYGPFDAIFCSGLLYHLDTPRKFLMEASQVCRRIILIHTHVAWPHETPARAFFNLSPLCENENATGRWLTEHYDPPASELDAMKQSSWENRRSFWLEKKCLIQILLDAGFDSVFESFDCMDNVPREMTDGYYANMDRVFIVGIKCGSDWSADEAADELRRSTSWRVTAPLRAIGRVFGR